MSGLYNEIFGINTLAPFLLGILGLDLKAIPRFRDCSVSEDFKEIIIYTRTGGSNRECDCDSLHADDCYAFLNEKMRKHPSFVRDYDDDFDKTYAYWVFKVSEDNQRILEDLIKGTGTTQDQRQIGQKFKDLIADMHAGKKSSLVERAEEVGRRIIGQIEKDLE